MTDLLSKERLEAGSLTLRAFAKNIKGVDAIVFIEAASAIDELLQRRDAAEKPVAWTDEQELRDVEQRGCGYLFTVNPITPNADMRRVIPLFTAPLLPVVPPMQDAVAWMVLRDGDPTFPRLFKSEEKADFMVKQVELNPKAVKVPLAPNQALHVAPDEITFEQACIEVKGLSPAEAFMKAWNSLAAILQHVSLTNEGNNYPAIPEGWALVPRTANIAMIRAGGAAAREHMEETGGNSPAVIYSAMLAATPQPPAQSNRIVPILPVRDEYGFWRHPNRIETPFDEGGASTRIYEAWFAERGMAVDFTYMNQVFCEDCCYGENVDNPALHWNPESPYGDGWILTAIFDTEDGPCAEWVRYTSPVGDKGTE